MAMTLSKQPLKMALLLTLSEKEIVNHPYILVDDVLTAFQTLAAYYLEK